MADLKQNTTYGNQQSTPVVPTGVPQIKPGAVKYTPSNTYKYLAQMSSRGTTPQTQLTPASNPLPGTPEYDSAKEAALIQYGQLSGNGQGIPLGTQFLPPDDINASSPIPVDYGAFATPAEFKEGGENISWGTPINPVIKNISGDTAGQYVEDTADPNLLVKTVRGKNTMADQAILNGRPGFMYQIDHIMPLELGGADTLANRQVLTYGQYDAKNRAQAVPYTLYAYGQISLKEAREMAMRWKDRDLTDVPLPNGIGILPDTSGRTGLQIAKDTAAAWANPQPKKETLRDQIGKIPEMAKNFGEGWLPDTVREFLKGTASGATLGFIPYEQDEGEGLDDKIAGIAGMAIGGIGSFMIGEGFLNLGLRAAGLAAKGSVGIYRGVAAAKAIESGLVGAETAAELAGTTKTASTIFKTLNKVPGYLQNAFLEGAVAKEAGVKATNTILSRLGKIGATSMIIGQGSQFIQNKFNPYTISGQTYEADAGTTNTIKRMVGDFAMGAAVGILPPTIKGTAGAIAMPLTLGLLANPDDPTTAITDALVFGAIHGMGSVRANKAGYNDVVSIGGKPYESSVTKAFEQTVNKASYATLSNYAPEVYPTLKPGETIPTTAHNQVSVQAAVDSSITNVVKKYLGVEATPEKTGEIVPVLKKYSENIGSELDAAQKQKVPFLEKLSIGKRKEISTANKAQETMLADEFGRGYQDRNKLPSEASIIPETGTMSLQELFSEIKRITVAGRQMYKGGLVGEIRAKADMDDLLSYGKSLLDRKNNELNSQKTRYDSLRKNISQPADIIPTVDKMTELFGKESFNNSKKTESGKYPIKTGDVVITGAGVNDVQKTNARIYFDAKRAGHADPKITLTIRPEYKNIFELGNKIVDPELVKNGSYSIDPHPEHAIQANATIYLIDPKTGLETGKKQILELGMVASDGRLNNNFNKDHLAFNKSPFVLEGKLKKLTPENHKDTLGDFMTQNNLKHLIVNIDPAATDVTVLSQQPFILTNINDASIEASFRLRDSLSSQPDMNPVSVDIANIKNSLTAKQSQEAIKKMKTKVVEPARGMLPKPENPDSNIHYKATDNVLKNMERSLEATNPQELKASFQKDLKWTLTDEMATDLFNRRNDITVRNGIKMLVNAVNEGKTDVATKIKLQSTKTYLESGILKFSPIGDAVLDMPIVGKMKKNQYTGQEEHIVTPTIKQESVPPPVAPEIKNISSSVSPEGQNETAVSIMDKIVNHPETREYLNIKKKPTSQVVGEAPLSSKETRTASDLAKTYIPELQMAIEDAKFSGRGYGLPEHGSVISNWEQRVQADLQSRGVSSKIIEEVKKIGRTAGEGQSEQQVSLKEGETTESLFGAPKDIERPKFIAREFYNSIDQGITSEKPATKYFYKTLDSVLKSVVGPKYKENPNLPKILADFLSSKVSDESNIAGRERTQPKAVIERRGVADFQGAKKAYATRSAEVKENPSSSGGTLSNREIADIGLTPDEAGKGFSGMTVKTGTQSDSMIHDLTRLEDMMSALFSDAAKNNPATASVSAIKELTFGDRENIGLRKYLLDNLPGAKKTPIPFEKLVAEAKNIDKESSPKIENLSKLIDKSIEKYANIIKTIHNPYPQGEVGESLLFDRQPKIITDLEKGISTLGTAKKLAEDYKTGEPLPAGMTPEIVKDNVADVISNLNRALKMMKETEGDGGGGPGYINNGSPYLGGGTGYGDGKGGLGDMVGNMWNKLKNGNVYTYDLEKERTQQASPFLSTKYDTLATISKPPVMVNKPQVVKPASPVDDFDYNKFLKALRLSETSVIGGDPYPTWQPSGKKDYGRALGAYRVTESELAQKSKRYLGRVVTPDEFLKSPQLQDLYVLNQAKYRHSEGYTPQQMADFHKKGTGVLLSPEAEKYKPGSANYQDPERVDRFMEFYNSL